MKIKSLQISNILSFRHHDNIVDAAKITFEDDLNIIIGENGSGKSTALEVINFLFKRVLYKQYNVNQDFYSRKSLITADERRQILQPANINSYSGFRLDPNWDSEDKPQVIRIEIKLDEIDIKNLNHLKSNIGKLDGSIGFYTTRGTSGLTTNLETYTLDITLNKNNQNFSIAFQNCAHDFGYEYLTDYNFYKESIAIYNLEHPKEPMDSLYESFTLISSYRNYHNFEKAISFNNRHPSLAMQDIKISAFSKSLNTADQTEPTIFGLVRLRVAEEHYNLNSQKYDDAECEALANKMPFLVDVNDKLKAVNLKCKIKLIN